MESNPKKIQSTLTRWADYDSMTWLTLISLDEYGKKLNEIDSNQLGRLFLVQKDWP